MEESSNVMLYVIGFCLRLGLLNSNLFGLSERPELATPLNSFKRLKEGVYLEQSGRDPYDGVLFHETPYTLKIFSFLFSNCSETFIECLFVLADVATAVVLSRVAKLVAFRLVEQQAKNQDEYHKDTFEELCLKKSDIISMSNYVQVVYLLHPYLIASCAAKTTTVFANLLLALFLLNTLKQRQVVACMFLALATYQSFYPVMLLVPLIMLNNTKESTLRYNVVLKVISIFMGFMVLIYYSSYLLMDHSWTFVTSTIGFIVTVPELTPNMGLFWYFFTEMFEHFRAFFVSTFQINCFIYVYPLAARLKDQPYLLAISLISLTAIFKSYPGYGDVGFYMALLPTVGYLFPYMKQNFLVLNTLIATTILGPISYQLWIYNGSANANYFFAITLVFSTAQIFLVTDLLFAYVKREFSLRTGLKTLNKDHTSPLILLQ